MDSVLKKVKKVLAKTKNNPSKEEAQSAMLKAQELLAKHNLSMEDVKIFNEEIDNSVVDQNLTDYKRTLWWEKVLAVIIADNFKCFAYLDNYNGKSRLKFLGKKEDIKIAKEVFHFARETVKYQSDNYVKHDFEAQLLIKAGGVGKNLLKNDFIKGWLDGLRDKFKEQVEKNQWGLVLVRDKDVQEEIEKRNFRKGRSSRVKSAGNSQARQEGYKNGKKFDYNMKALKGGV